MRDRLGRDEAVETDGTMGGGKTDNFHFLIDENGDGFSGFDVIAVDADLVPTTDPETGAVTLQQQVAACSISWAPGSTPFDADGSRSMSMTCSPSAPRPADAGVGAGEHIDFESFTDLTVRVTASGTQDGTATSITRDLRFKITDVNEAPTGVTADTLRLRIADPDALPEGGVKVTDLTATGDPDAVSAATFAVGGTDAAV